MKQIPKHTFMIVSSYSVPKQVNGKKNQRHVMFLHNPIKLSYSAAYLAS